MNAIFAFGSFMRSMNESTIFGLASVDADISANDSRALSLLGYRAAMMYLLSAGVVSLIIPEGETRTRRPTRPAFSEANSAATCPPIDEPIRCARSTPSRPRRDSTNETKKPGV